MKFIGLELCNYAQIERQFIPAAKGLHLLVGKNNSGKSATLRFLDAEQAAHISRYAASAKQPQLVAIAKFDERDQSPVSSAGIAELNEDGAFARLVLDATKRNIVGGQIYWRNIQGKQFLHGRSVANTSTLQLTTLNEKGDAQHTADLGRALAIPRLSPLVNTVYIAPHRQIAASTAMTQTNKIPPAGANLAAYLQTLHGERREAFEEIEAAFCELFPDFDRLILSSNQNNVSIQPRLAKSNQQIPLERCGSGLEQALVILAALYQPTGSELLLIDEPHNFLHPDAERKLAIRFSESDKQVIVATHSPVMINSAPPDRLIPIEAPGSDYETFQKRDSRAAPAKVFANIGFRNSDALFHDRLIFVEGESDATVLPILLEQAGLQRSEILATGFPVIHGLEEMHDLEKIAARLIVFEKLLLSIGRTRQRHLYFLDGDRRNIHSIIAKATIQGEHISTSFTPGREMENLFIDPAVIARGLQAQATLNNLDIDPDETTIASRIDELLQLDASHPKFRFLFPDERPAGSNAIDVVKGSRLLTEIYWDHLLPYEKRLSGKLLAEQIARHDQRLKTFVDPLIGLIRESQ